MRPGAGVSWLLAALLYVGAASTQAFVEEGNLAPGAGVD